MKKVLGIGNALVDILVRLQDDSLLNEIGFPKGSMQLVDLDKSNEILAKVEALPKELAAGGSAANTINGLACLGIETRFIGKVGDDEMGRAFSRDQAENGIDPHLLPSEHPSGRAVAMITPDSERTFGTFLGAAMYLDASDLKAGMFSGYDILHLEGYLVLNQDLIITAARLAKQAGMKVSIDLASFNVVEDNLDFLKNYVKEHVDILFANEEEAKAFTGLEPEAALDVIAEDVDIAVVKIGARGSLVKRGQEKDMAGVIPVKPIDTTGAGDLYASGFLAAMIHDLSLGQCATAGSILAGNVIEGFGSKMEQERWSRIRTQLQDAGITL